MSQQLWGTPPLRGAYNNAPPTQVGGFGAREFASVAANSAITTGAFVASATAIEAYVADGQSMLDVNLGLRLWAVQHVFFVALKVLAAMLRSCGSSWIRDFFAWLWATCTATLRRKLNPFDQESRDGRKEKRIDRRIERRGWLRKLFFKRRVVPAAPAED